MDHACVGQLVAVRLRSLNQEVKLGPRTSGSVALLGYFVVNLGSYTEIAGGCNQKVH